MKTGNSNEMDAILYDVQSGDNLSSIIKSYHGTITLQKQKQIIDTILLENPEIKNASLIYPGQILVMDIPAMNTPQPALITPTVVQGNKTLAQTVKTSLRTAPPAEKQMLSGLAPVMLGTGVTSLTMINHTFKSNAPLLSEMAENYNDYKANAKTRGQYDYKRQSLISRLKAKLGPTNYLLNGNKPPNEILRISRKKGQTPTHVITRQASQMKTLSKLASRGGVVLSAAGLGVACHEMANTNDKQKKNEILVESLGGLVGGAASGLVVSVLFIGTPIGWVAALAIGVGSVATSYVTGQLAKNTYTTYGSHIDLASITHANELCR